MSDRSSPLVSRPHAARLAVVTPWYPCEQRPFAGSFVQASTDAVAPHFAEVDVLHGEDWPCPAGTFQADLIRTAHARLVGAAPARVPVHPLHGDERHQLRRVPVPVQPGQEYADWALAHEQAIRAALPTGQIEADVVHGHVGTYGGWVACQLARPGARVVVTEHASFLPRMLRQRRSREVYREVLHRADAFLVVSELLRQRLVATFPTFADKIHVVPNLVDTGTLAARTEPVRRLHRWLYLGSLATGKGVPELLEAFATVAAQEDEPTLTMVGSGLDSRLRRRAEELGVAARLTFRGPQPPWEVPELLREHDLLVHPSKFETFGMTTAEAIAVGTPVLVSRCGGPEWIMDGLEPAAGRLIDVSTDPQVIVDGYHALAAQLDQLDPGYARAQLERRFGRDRVAAELLSAYGHPNSGAAPQRPAATRSTAPHAPAGQPVADHTQASAPPEAAEGYDTQPTAVAFLTLGGNRMLALREETGRLVERGVRVDVFALDPDIREHAELDPRVAVHSVYGLSRIRGGRRLRGVDRLARAALLARLVERRLMRDVTGTQLVLVDAHAFALAWRIARRRPRLRLRLAPDRGPDQRAATRVRPVLADAGALSRADGAPDESWATWVHRRSIEARRGGSR